MTINIKRSHFVAAVVVDAVVGVSLITTATVFGGPVAGVVVAVALVGLDIWAFQKIKAMGVTVAFRTI